MQKKFLQLHLGFIFLQLFISIFLVSGIAIFVYGSRLCNWFIILVGVIWSLFIGYQMYIMCSYIIIFDDEVIKTNGDRQPKLNKIQYGITIKYEDILNIKVISSSKDSKNETIKAKMLSKMAPKTYFEISTKDGRKERLFILYFSNKQRKKMLILIKDRAKNNNNNLDFVNESIINNIIVVR